jgi:3-hydroxybutyryl-CoA dehydrogenase
MEPVDRVGVIGCGTMGCGIAEVNAVAGLDVVVREVTEELVAAGRDRVESSLRRKVKAGKATDADVEEALGRMRFTTDLGELADRDLVVEAIVELEDVKRELFRDLDAIVERPDAILASNTSSLPITKLAGATSRPGQVVGLHFFNPVPVLPLVEVIAGQLTTEDTLARSEAYVTETLAKDTIRSKDRAGFIVNTMLIPYLLSAVRLLEAGVGTAEDIDTGMVKGCAHPMGPLALADLIGLDTTLFVANAIYAEVRDPACVAPQLLLRMVEAGLLGRKTGRGFYDYGS